MGIANNDLNYIGGGVNGIRGPGGATWRGAAGARYANGQFVGGYRWAAVNGSFANWTCFTPNWYVRYPGAWAYAGWTTAWANATWANTYAYCGCASEPVYYDYGDTVYYQDQSVHYGDQVVASADDYYAQAATIAQSGAPPAPAADQSAPPADEGEWMPLGIFSFLAEGQTTSNLVMQIAINKDGQIRGNYYNTQTDQVTPLYGSADKETQRVAMRVQGNETVVMECGLYNLTNDEVPILLHKGAQTAENWSLVRLQQPEERAQQAQN